MFLRFPTRELTSRPTNFRFPTSQEFFLLFRSKRRSPVSCTSLFYEPGHPGLYTFVLSYPTPVSLVIIKGCLMSRGHLPEVLQSQWRTEQKKNWRTLGVTRLDATPFPCRLSDYVLPIFFYCTVVVFVVKVLDWPTITLLQSSLETGFYNSSTLQLRLLCLPQSYFETVVVEVMSRSEDTRRLTNSVTMSLPTCKVGSRTPKTNT